MAATTILVTGGTGTLGRHVVRRLTEDGHRVRVLSRRSGADLVTGDLRTGAGLAGAVRDVDVIVHCAVDPRGDDVAATGRLIAAAEQAHVPHLVYISIVGVDRMPLGHYRKNLALALIGAVAAVAMERRMIMATMAGYLLFSVPHLVFHTTHLGRFPRTDAVSQTAVLGFGCCSR